MKWPKFFLEQNFRTDSLIYNHVPRTHVDEAKAKGEIWSNSICTHDHLPGMWQVNSWQVIEEGMLKINPKITVIFQCEQNVVMRTS